MREIDFSHGDNSGRSLVLRHAHWEAILRFWRNLGDGLAEETDKSLKTAATDLGAVDPPNIVQAARAGSPLLMQIARENSRARAKRDAVIEQLAPFRLSMAELGRLETSLTLAGRG